MHANEKLLHDFYSAFQRKDAEAMAACYADNVVFNDAVFVDLRGREASDMWRMLCANGKDLELTFSDVHADDAQGRAHWEARYTFSATGKKVHNIIDARFTFRDGRIATHTDSFDFYRWSKQAFGVAGVLLGWTPILRNTVRKQARRALDKFSANAHKRAA